MKRKGIAVGLILLGITNLSYSSSNNHNYYLPSNGRGYITFKNMTGEKIKLVEQKCLNTEGLHNQTILSAGQSITKTITSNDRYFATWEGLDDGMMYKSGWTSPKSSHNSATGYGASGLHSYSRTGYPDFIFNIGEEDQADWNNGDEYTGATVDYGDCS